MSDYHSFGYALAARVLQSDLYHKLDERERGECDELLRRGMGRPSSSEQPAHTDHPLRHWDRTCPACVAEGQSEKLERSVLDMTQPDDNLRWALAALELATNGLRNRRALKADDIEMHNLGTVKASIENARETLVSATPDSDTAKDAARYRWLRSQPMLDGHALVSLELMDINEDGPTGAFYSYDGEELDAAIDAALSSTASKVQP